MLTSGRKIPTAKPNQSQQDNTIRNATFRLALAPNTKCQSYERKAGLGQILVSCNFASWFPVIAIWEVFYLYKYPCYQLLHFLPSIICLIPSAIYTTQVGYLSAATPSIKYYSQLSLSTVTTRAPSHCTAHRCILAYLLPDSSIVLMGLKRSAAA
jgi:hypothetical protein